MKNKKIKTSKRGLTFSLEENESNIEMVANGVTQAIVDTPTVKTMGFLVACQT